MAKNRSETDLIVVHCAATPAKMDIGAREIHGWHLNRGISSDRGVTGYHFVIRRDGRVEWGRELDEIGAHALGFNEISVGVCLVGGADAEGEPEDNFTPEQGDALASVLSFLLEIYPGAMVCGHRDLPDVRKACPSFDVFDWCQQVWGRSDRVRVEEWRDAW